jgi:hypothetical protein
MTFFQDLALDPTAHQHLLVTFHDNCGGAFAPNCLAESLDGGATFRLVKGPLPGWGEGAGPFILGGARWLMTTPQNGAFFSGDSGATWKQVAQGMDRQLYRVSGGSYFVGSDYGVLRSADGETWTKIEGAPTFDAVIGDGTRLFGSVRFAEFVSAEQQPYFTSLESDGNTWTSLPSPKMKSGGVYFAYDADHKLLYSANTATGLWRMKTQAP